jgi:hypothetical protein
MSLRKFLYYLLEEDGRSISVQNGVITSSGTKRPLNYSPIGEMLFAWERNITKHGIVRNYGNEIATVLDGAMICRDAFYNYNINRKIFLLIQELKLVYTDDYWKWYYDYLYRGELDLSTSRDSVDKFSVNIMEGGLFQLLKANEDTTYTFLFDEESVNISWPGLELFRTATYLFAGEIPKSIFGSIHTPNISFINSEGDAGGSAFFSQNLEQVSGSIGTYVSTSTNYFLINNSGETQTYRLHGTIKFLCTDNDIGASYRFDLYKSDGTGTLLFNNSNLALVVGQEYTVPFDVNITLLNEEKLFWINTYFGLFSPGSIDVAVNFSDDSRAVIDFSNTYEETKSPAYTRKVIWRKLCEKVFGNKDYGISTLFENDDRILTSTEAIRGLPEPKIKISIGNFFKDVDSDLMAGMGIEPGVATASLVAGNRVSIESREYYYNDSDPIDLGEIKDLEVTYSADLISNRLKFGSPKPDIEDLNGRYDPNGSSEFISPENRVAGEYDMISPFKSGPYEIESIRVNLRAKDTTDDNRDNDIFVVVVERKQEDEVTQVSFISSLNLMITPGGIEFVTGQKIKIEGSVSNDNTFTILGAAYFLGITFVVLDGPALVDETDVSVLITFLTGILYQPKIETFDNSGDPEDFGAPSPTTLFNTQLTPKSRFLRHKRWLASMAYKFDNEKIKWTSSTNNSNLKTINGSIIIDEDRDENISELGPIMFQPYYLDFETKTPVNPNLTTLMEENPFRSFRFTEYGIEYIGFNFRAGFAPDTLASQRFKLLSSPLNDLTQKI